MFDNLKPIETIYKGNRFRSRLEARWAVFFNALGIEYLYEPEGFEFDGIKLLPDFYLPTFDGSMFVEVKFQGGDFTKAIAFAKHFKTRMWICEGDPQLSVYKIIDYKNDDNADGIDCGIPNFDQAVGDNRMYGKPCIWCHPEDCGHIHPVPCPSDFLKDYEHYEGTYCDAVLAAKMARFEFGEEG